MEKPVCYHINIIHNVDSKQLLQNSCWYKKLNFLDMSYTVAHLPSNKNGLNKKEERKKKKPICCVLIWATLFRHKNCGILRYVSSLFSMFFITPSSPKAPFNSFLALHSGIQFQHHIQSKLCIPFWCFSDSVLIFFLIPIPTVVAFLNPSSCSS